MDLPPRGAPKHVPVLTEVIDAVDLVAQPAPTTSDPESDPPQVTAVSEPAPPAYASIPLLDVPTIRETVMAAVLPVQPVLDEGQVAQRVLADVQRQIDSMLEYRLREALSPILARVSDGLIRDLRQELSKTMTDVVTRSVAQEVARQRSRH